MGARVLVAVALLAGGCGPLMKARPEELEGLDTRWVSIDRSRIYKIPSEEYQESMLLRLCGDDHKLFSPAPAGEELGARDGWIYLACWPPACRHWCAGRDTYCSHRGSPYARLGYCNHIDPNGRNDCRRNRDCAAGFWCRLSYGEESDWPLGGECEPRSAGANDPSGLSCYHDSECHDGKRCRLDFDRRFDAAPLYGTCEEPK